MDCHDYAVAALPCLLYYAIPCACNCIPHDLAIVYLSHHAMLCKPTVLFWSVVFIDMPCHIVVLLLLCYVLQCYTIPCGINLQATKLFIVTSATKGGGYHPLRFRVRFKILYRVIQPLIQHSLLHTMVYLSIIYVIATRNYEFFTTGIFP